MKKFILSFFLILTGLVLVSQKASATHIYGADFFYTYAGGTSYTVTLVVYGDCSGSSFPNLSSSAPEVELYNGTTLITTQNLSIQAPSTGIEVTPVCPSQLSNTTCVSSTGTIPGVKKFTYSGTFTINSTSSAWKFRFTGTMGSTSSAGRSTSITNISSGSGGSIMALEATLNNTVGANSSPVYTTIPTPFFCINVPANNNPGTVDPNADNLSYGLVPGLVNTGGTVTYLSGYSATAPLAVSTGTFSFNTSTGQLGFTPNAVQRSLVVFQVEEYRGSTLVGTSMREMTFVVLNNCNNNPPTGSISSASAGTVGTGGNTLTVCKSSNTLTFNINPTDAEGNVINVAYSGIPAGATFTVSNNNTTAPAGSFSWNLSTATPGTYNFFITYTDDGCPLSSKQTIAYTIYLLAEPAVAYSLISPATCTRKARFNLTPSVSPSPWGITILQGTTVIHSFTGLTGTKLDSLDPGTYTVRVTNANGCFKDTTIIINAPPAIIPSVSMIRPTCFGGNNGSITITAGGGVTPFTYALGSGSYSSVNTFTNLISGTYTLHIKDGNDCIKDTTVNLTDPPAITVSIASTKPKCNYYNSGLITVSASNGTSPYQYAIGTGSFSTTNTFSGLFSGTYVLHIKDANNCLKDSTFILNDSISVHANATVTNVLCNGDATGAITLSGFGGTSPYDYRKNPGSFSTTNSFTGLAAATYTFRVRDIDSCYLDTSIAITQPVRITSTSVVSNVLCFGQSNGSITITGAGGVGPYTYAIGSGSYSSTNLFSGLTAGSYTLHIKDANNCIKDTIITVTQPAVLAFSNIAIVQPICNSTATGSITITGTGGTTPYTYAINASAYISSNIFVSIAAGSYAMHLKDNNGCTVDSTVTVGEPTAIIPSLQVKKSTCTPLNDGRVIVNATGGVPAYTYAVGSGLYSSVNSFTPLATGSYTFHIKDTRGCVKDTTMNLLDSIVVTANYVISNIKCFADSSGFITINPTAGVPVFTYAKGSGSFAAPNTFYGLPIGTYVIHIKDNLGCTKDTSITLTQPTALTPFASFTEPSCNGYANGTVTIGAFGGTPPYSYAMGTGTYVASGSFTGVKGGTYTFHIKDANNCIHDTTITVTEPTPLVYGSMNITNVLCNGDSSGQVVMIASGGTPAYTYAYDNSPYTTTGSTVTGLKMGIHIMRIKDAKGCYRDSVLTITEPPKLILMLPTVTPPTCESFTDAEIIADAAGGVKPYMYSINSGAYSPSGTFNNLSEGQYLVIVKDLNGCTDDTTVNLSGYPHIVFDEIKVTPVSCFGYTDGKVELQVSGGIQPLKYQFNNGQVGTVTSFFDLVTGTYKIRVIDSKNCTKDTTAYVATPDKLKTALKVTPNDCEGYDDGGSVKAEVIGGTQPYNYKWSIEKSTNSDIIYNLANGRYMVWVTDNNSCKDSTVSEVVYNNCCKIFIPDAFTPNGDGKNDIIRVLYKGDFLLKTFMIYNRYGQRVFETNDTRGAWDGVYKGQPQDMDTYNYYIKGICGNNGTQEVEYKGTIMLVK